MNKTILTAALSLLMLPGATAFAGEGTFQPQQVASPASGTGAHAPIGTSFVYSQGEGGQIETAPAFAATGVAAAPVASMPSYNAGLNG